MLDIISKFRIADMFLFINS